MPVAVDLTPGARVAAGLQLQQTIVGQQVSVNTALVMCGISKVFVGEVVEMGARLRFVPPRHLCTRHPLLEEGRCPASSRGHWTR